MTGPLILLLIVGVLVGVVATMMRGSKTPAEDALPQRPRPPDPVTAPPPASPTARANVLQPFSPIPLTVLNASPEAVSALRLILDDQRSWGRDRQERILGWLLTTNARIEEVDAFISKWGAKFETAVKTLSESDPDWASASELDRKDILGDAIKKALASLEVRAHELDYEVISRPPSLAATSDDELLARYGFELLSFYFQKAEDLDRVYTVPSDDWERSRFESMTKQGLARRGAEISPVHMLSQLTLKDMEEVAAGIEHKRFTRRAPAIEFLEGLPDLRERLSKQVSMRELFQLVPLASEFAHLDLAALGHAWAYTAEYAKLIEVTYATAQQANEAVTGAFHDEHSKGWSVVSYYGDEPCCSACAEHAGDRRGARTAPRLPHHVGCVCRLSQIYE